MIEDPATHPAFRGVIETLAGLYDRQWEEPQATLFRSPTSANLVGLPFLVPRTGEDLVRIGRAIRYWEEGTQGMMGRQPSYLARAAVGLAAGSPHLAEEDARFGENARRYLEYLRENDLCSTATIASPQVNRGQQARAEADPFVAARIKEETGAGLVIRGARTLATLPIADEILAYSASPLRDAEKDAPYAFVFAIPTHTPGLKFICRESVDYGRSWFDHPLGSRFDEMDATVFFDDVLVPWENVFAYRDTKRCNSAFSRSGAMAHMDHQVLIKNTVKAEFFMGLALLLVDALGVEVYQHIYEKLSEIWVDLELMKACVRAAEADAELDEWGVMRPDSRPLLAGCTLFSRAYPRIVEIIQQIGASGVIAMPTRADLNGPFASEVRACFQAARADALDRIPLFRLAWDATISAFGGRQVVYERFARGDPVRLSNALILMHQGQLQEYAARVVEFVRRAQG